MESAQKLARELDNLIARTPIELRRWYVQNVVLNQANRLLLREMDPPASLIALANGRSPSAEHTGVAARMLYTDMYQFKLMLPNLPSIRYPKSWNQADSMANLIMYRFAPWQDFRYDPRAETIQVALGTGQWAFHLKGKDSEQVVISRLYAMIRTIADEGFKAITDSLYQSDLLSVSAADNGMDPEEFGRAWSASAASFTKFVSRDMVKDMLDAVIRHPLMAFDTSVVNCVTGMAAFGNGVVPTDDVWEQKDDYFQPVVTIPAGRLIQADREFMLSSAAGLEWPHDSRFEQFVNYRAAIHNGESEEGWNAWIDGARQFSDQILSSKCKTYKAFLDHAFPNDDHTPPEERDAFLRLIGAAVFGSNLKIVAAMIGAPNAGKDTVIKWLSMILGNDQVGVLSPMALTAQADDQRAFAPLKGARVAVVSGEVGAGRNTAILAEKVKSITSGGGTLTVAEKYEKPTTIFFDGMLIMQGNSVPTIVGGDSALYKNRLVAVEFKYPFDLQANSYEAEYRREAPYFLQVLFLAYCDYVERGGGMIGIAPPQSWREFGDDVEFSADPLTVIDRCITEPTRTLEIPSTVMYKALSILAERNLGLKYGMSSGRWAARLKKSGVEITKNKNTRHRTAVNRQDFKGWMFHFTLNADNSDGLFTDEDWKSALQDAMVALNLKN